MQIQTRLAFSYPTTALFPLNPTGLGLASLAWLMSFTHDSKRLPLDPDCSPQSVSSYHCIHNFLLCSALSQLSEMCAGCSFLFFFPLQKPGAAYETPSCLVQLPDPKSVFLLCTAERGGKKEYFTLQSSQFWRSLCPLNLYILVPGKKKNGPLLQDKELE